MIKFNTSLLSVSNLVFEWFQTSTKIWYFILPFPCSFKVSIAVPTVLNRFSYAFQIVKFSISVRYIFSKERKSKRVSCIDFFCQIHFSVSEFFTHICFCNFYDEVDMFNGTAIFSSIWSWGGLIYVSFSFLLF